MFTARHINRRFLATVCALVLAGLLGMAGSARAVTSVLSPSPASWDFGDDDIHSGGGPSQNFTFTNNSAGNVNVSADTVGGPDASDFQRGSDGCSGAFLPPAGSCSVQVTFNATTPGPKTASLEVTDDTGTVDVPLSGTGITGTLTASPSPVDFSPQPWFYGGQQQGLNIQNSGVGTCRTVNAARNLHPGGRPVTVSYPQPSVPWAPLTLTARETLSASIDGQAVGRGRRVTIRPRTLAAYTDGAHTLKVSTHGHSVQTPLLLAQCSLAVRVDGGPGQGGLISLATRAAMGTATITLPRGLYLRVTARKLGRFTCRRAGYPGRTFDIVGSRTTSNNVTVTVSRHTIHVSNLPARTGVIRFTTRTGVLAGTGGTAHATAKLAGTPRQQTSHVPATWLR